MTRPGTATTARIDRVACRRPGGGTRRRPWRRSRRAPARQARRPARRLPGARSRRAGSHVVDSTGSHEHRIVARCRTRPSISTTTRPRRSIRACSRRCCRTSPRRSATRRRRRTQWGWKAQEAVEAARREVAALIGATAREIVFTSGATESNNLAIQGVVAEHAPPTRRQHRRLGDRAQVACSRRRSGSSAARLARHGRCRSRATAAIDLDALDARS